MIKSFEQYIKESKDLFVPRNLEGRHEEFLRTVQEKLSKNNIWDGTLDLWNINVVPEWFKFPDNLQVEGDFHLGVGFNKIPTHLYVKYDMTVYNKNIRPNNFHNAWIEGNVYFIGLEYQEIDPTDIVAFSDSDMFDYYVETWKIEKDFKKKIINK